METMEQSRIIEIYREALHGFESILDGLTKYELEKLRDYGLDYEHNLEPKTRVQVERKLNGLPQLEEHPFRPNAQHLNDLIKVKIESFNLDKQKGISKQPEKIKWLGTPSQFGFIISELQVKGFIEIPKNKGTESFSAFARQLFEVFDIPGKNGTTSLENLKKELNPSSNSLSQTTKDHLFKIPNISELS